MTLPSHVRSLRVSHLQKGRPPRDAALARRQERSEELMRAAAIVLERQGVRTTTMDALAQALGIPKAVLYRYFPSKDELVRTILRRVLVQWAALQQKPWRGLRTNLQEVLALARKEPSALLLLARHCSTDPDLRPFFDEFRQSVVDRTDTLLRSQSATLRDDRLLRAVCTQAVTGFLFEAVLWWIENGEPARDADFLSWARSSLNALYRRWMPDADWTRPPAARVSSPME